MPLQRVPLCQHKSAKLQADMQAVISKFKFVMDSGEGFPRYASQQQQASLNPKHTAGDFYRFIVFCFSWLIGCMHLFI